MKTIGQKIRARRKQLGLTVTEAARRADISRESLYNLEGGRNATLHTLEAVLKVLDGRLKVKFSEYVCVRADAPENDAQPTVPPSD